MEIFIMVLLAIASIIGVTVMVERGLVLRRHKVLPPELEAALDRYQSPADLPVLRQVCELHPSPLGRLLLNAAGNLRRPRAENVNTLETRARFELAGLDRWIVILEILTGIAPLLGLVGTVFGLITLFNQGLSQRELGDYTALARGIGVALRATLMGLMVAIPSLIAWSYYSKRVEAYGVELESRCQEFLDRSYGGGAGDAPAGAGAVVEAGAKAVRRA